MKLPTSASTQLNHLQVGFRWLLLLALGVAAGGIAHPLGRLGAGAILVGAAVLNLMLLVAMTTGRKVRYLPEISLAADSFLALLLYTTSGRAHGPLGGAGLLPIFSASLTFGQVAALGTGIGLVVAFGLLGLIFDPLGLGGAVAWLLQALVLGGAAAVAGIQAERLRSASEMAARAAQDDAGRSIQQVRERGRIIYEMASMVSATLDHARVLEAALDLGIIGLQDLGESSQEMVAAVLLFEEQALEVKTARRFSRADLAAQLPGQAGVVGQALANGRATHTAEPAADEELSRLASVHGCRSLVCLPLRAGFETYGVVLFGHPRENFFDADHLQLLEAICNQAIIALQNAQLYRDLLAEKERLIEVEEDARKKLARDLHDGPTQSVAAIAMRVNFARRLMERDQQAASGELFKVEDLARRTTKEIRHMLFTLRPLVLESQGLAAALRQLAEKSADTHGQKVIVEVSSDLAEQLDLSKQGVIFYIAEEAIGNARKHAQAQHVWVRLKGSRDVAVLEIQDDGAGFDLAAVDSAYDRRGSLGLLNMRERAELMSGVLRIDSAVGKGTKISVSVPLTEEARDRLRTAGAGARSDSVPAQRMAG